MTSSSKNAAASPAAAGIEAPQLMAARLRGWWRRLFGRGGDNHPLMKTGNLPSDRRTRPNAPPPPRKDRGYPSTVPQAVPPPPRSGLCPEPPLPHPAPPPRKNGDAS